MFSKGKKEGKKSDTVWVRERYEGNLSLPNSGYHPGNADNDIKNMNIGLRKKQRYYYNAESSLVEMNNVHK